MKNFQQWNGQPTGSEALILLFVLISINAFLITILTKNFTISFFQERFIVIHILTVVSCVFGLKLAAGYWKNRSN